MQPIKDRDSVHVILLEEGERNPIYKGKVKVWRF